MSMTLIEHIEVTGATAASIEFTSIPQTYTDLYLVVSARGDSGTWQKLNVRPNGSTANDTSRWLIGDGSGTGSSTEANILGRDYSSSSTTADTFGSGSIYIPNYASSEYKSFSLDTVGENNATEAIQSISAGLWSDTTAISSIELVLASGNFVQYSSATLYGISAGSDGVTTVT
jgi:hypothetical protein